ncbi:phage GP46 family protein [Komagataeibacter xylinus]|uniref:phage GP46 family protein n=1 Tax=Komagataeibacter xylinus TaxID=28448 RepID=UPI00280A95E9|nr:phage GP46 family protein [Komagataeibacter xylinus]
MAAIVPFSTTQVAYRASHRSCDLQIAPTAAGRGTVAIDTTPASEMLLAAGTDRRARADDDLPGGGTAPLSRRGFQGDVYLPAGQRAGSRMWLLVRANSTEQTRLNALSYAAESMAALEARHNVSVDIAAQYVRPGMIGITYAVNGTRVATAVTPS